MFFEGKVHRLLKNNISNGGHMKTIVIVDIKVVRHKQFYVVRMGLYHRTTHSRQRWSYDQCYFSDVVRDLKQEVHT